MTQHGIEMILMRRLAARLMMPIVVVDPGGDLVYFNAAAAPVFGRPFEATGPIARGEWSQRFRPAHPDGSAMKREELPLFLATEHRRPSHQRGWIRGLDGVERELDGIAFPLIGQCERMLGAVGTFWTPSDPPPRGRRREGPLDLASPGGDRPIELLLMRQLASYLSTAILLLRPDGRLVFYNEPAERLLGQRFEEAEEMEADVWSELLEPTDLSGARIALDERPMMVALRRQEPEHRHFSIRGFDGVVHEIEGLAFPLVDVDGWRNGVVGIFWDART